VKKEQNGRKSLRWLKPTVGCNASKRRRTTRVMNVDSEVRSTGMVPCCVVYHFARPSSGSRFATES
jgi:hypothetical protein